MAEMSLSLRHLHVRFVDFCLAEQDPQVHYAASVWVQLVLVKISHAFLSNQKPLHHV